MKKLLISVAIVLGMMATQQADAKVQYVNGKFVYIEDSTSTKQPDKRLPDYPIKSRDGKITFYPCYISKRGSVYIIRKNKDGEDRKSYLSKTKQNEIKQQLNIK